MSSPVIFSGLSTYAADFQTVIQRAVGIASLPISQLTNTKNRLTDQVMEYQKLDANASSLRYAMGQVTAALGQGSLATSVSDQSVLSATASAGALSGSYTVDVTSAGAYARYQSTAALTNTVATGPYTLTLNQGTGSSSYTITPGGTGLSDLVTAINQSGAPVQASMVNVGSNSNPQYRLALQSTKLAEVTMSLDGGSGDLLQQISAGQATSYVINGDTANPISGDSSTIQLAPGLSIKLLGTGTATVTVSNSTGALAAAVGSVVQAYNALRTELETNHGQGKSALKGSSQVLSLESSLRKLLTFQTPDGQFRSLVDLGVSLDKTGKASLNSSAIANASFAGLQAFFGDGTGPGFLYNANLLLDEMDGESSGVITHSIQSLTDQISKTNDAIDAQQARVDVLQNSLMEQLSVADSAIYSLQQQASYYQNLFAAMMQESRNITR